MTTPIVYHRQKTRYNQYNDTSFPTINNNTRSINDEKYIRLDTMDNKNISDYQVKNFRTFQYTKNPKYLFPIHHTFYDLQGIDEGQGAGMNPNLDSELTRPNWENLPDDRLSEHVTFIRYIDYLPPMVFKPTEFDHNRFFVSTSISDNPQRNFEPEFDFYGVCTRHYNRLSDEYFRHMANKSNKFRKPAKWYK